MDNAETNTEALQGQAIQSLNKTLKDLKIEAEAASCSIKGPLKRFLISLGSGVRIKKLDTFSQEIAMAMCAVADPLIMPNRVEGRLDGNVRLDLMTGEHPLVPFVSLAKSAGFDNPEILKDHSIPLLLGVEDIDIPLVVDLQKMPHLLVAGATGSGKSVLLHSCIESIILHSAQQGIRLALIDPKGGIEFGIYERHKALRYSVASDVDGAVEILDYLHETMDKRLALLAKYGCRNILEYRALGKQMPFIVLVVDELAGLMRAKKSGFADRLCSLLERCRAVGIHGILATQHPSREVITGLLKAQLPARIACKVASQTHSRVVLDENGAEKLLGSGDALLMDGVNGLRRFRGAYVDVSKRSQKKKAAKKKAQPKASKQKPAPKGTLLTDILGVMAEHFGK